MKKETAAEDAAIPAGADSVEANDEKREMKDCFGVNFGWFMEDMIGDPDQVRHCYDCMDFDRCQRMAQVRALSLLRFEIRRSAAYLGRAVNGASSMNPLG
ncbi:hypothetical protein JW916_10980 [Candidatus Sumerlaeota bacterium]|nr:hypothetical protein [Candidatus Sumerlaeota bacterium]